MGKSIIILGEVTTTLSREINPRKKITLPCQKIFILVSNKKLGYQIQPVTVQEEDEHEDEGDYDKVLLAGLSEQMLIVWAVDNVESDAIDPGIHQIKIKLL